ncbi:DUF5106 domain-containing protein [Sphingobacterium spiritivorum]|uniref:DUF5106 domain-containing protein n=2 Tax=Sphingobacterium spiritivorum TaxID=258 RepID=UPI00191B28FC|nr:DUF5106 domain-containing protein [Sphingobacterium spiritivorum]QQS95911.1 DUF5106 domain-containing protein [Sphingobacterium spiritivorum]
MKCTYLSGIVLGTILMVVFVSCRDTHTRIQHEKKDTSDSLNTYSSATGKRTIENFWDDFDFNDDELYKRDGEQAIADFIGLFPSYSPEEIQKSIFRMLSKAENNPEAFVFFQDLFKKYLYHPNSPLRNDMYYECVIDYLIISDKVSADGKNKYKQLLKILKKNKAGTEASSFSVTLQSGKDIRLEEIEAPFLLLMFYEPDCNSCKTIIENMKNMPELNELIDNKKLLKILAVYAIGNEDIWKDYFPQMPANWINGIDKNQFIINRNLYDLKASPTMYLLDKSKHVILKDSDLGHVLYFLTTNKQFN